MVEISIISPVYLAEKSLHRLVNTINHEVSKDFNSYEIILVDDGSPDQSWKIIEDLSQQDPKIKGIRLSRNFGQHLAVSAGIKHATGQYCVIMDCDLQDNPTHIVKLKKIADEGYDIVFTKRINRKHSIAKKIGSSLYKFFISILADKSFQIDTGSLVLFNRKVKTQYDKIDDRDRLYIQLLKWLGFRQYYHPIEHEERAEGKSTYSLMKLLNVAVNGLISHSSKLLKLSIYLGFFFSFNAFLSIVLIIFLYFINGFQSGWASTMVLILFSTGVILVSIGIAGIYIGKSFEQIKNKPIYVIDEKLNFKDE